MRERMAMAPQSAELLPNPVGAAPGIKVKNNVILFSLPECHKKHKLYSISLSYHGLLIIFCLFMACSYTLEILRK